METIAPAGMRIVPIIGAITEVKASDISAYQDIISTNGLSELHFYTYEKAAFAPCVEDAAIEPVANNEYFAVVFRMRDGSLVRVAIPILTAGTFAAQLLAVGLKALAAKVALAAMSTEGHA
jgi:hypothetical protein